MTEKKLAAQTFEHNGHTVTLTASGKFTTMHNGARHTAPSLVALMAKLQKAATFTEFEVLVSKWGEAPTVEKVTGIEKNRARFSQHKHHWVVAGGRNTDYVIENTAENRAALKAQRELMKKHEKIRANMSAESDAAQAAIKRRYVSPEDFK